MLTGSAEIAQNDGLPGDKPLVGDWTANGYDSIGVFRANTFYLRNSNTNGFAEIIYSFGNTSDEPLAGDWNGLL